MDLFLGDVRSCCKELVGKAVPGVEAMVFSGTLAPCVASSRPWGLQNELSLSPSSLAPAALWTEKEQTCLPCRGVLRGDDPAANCTYFRTGVGAQTESKENTKPVPPEPTSNG